MAAPDSISVAQLMRRSFLTCGSIRPHMADLDLAPQAAGLLAASLGLSRMYRDDLAQLDAAMGLYDAFYRWARDAVGETHNWPAPSSGTLS